MCSSTGNTDKIINDRGEDMLNMRYLETFLTVAEEGSFRRAADTLYITASAVIKQIDALEAEIGVPLFDRTHRGLKLTESGISLQKDAVMLMELSESAVQRARKAAESHDDVLYIGTSPVTPADMFTAVWEKVYTGWPQLKVQIVPFQNTAAGVRSVFEGLGRQIDIISGTVDRTHLAYRNCGGCVLEYCPVYAAVSRNHPLTAKKTISMKDLEGQTVMLMARGKMETMDQIREDLIRNHVRIVDFDFYDTEVFNRCEQEGLVLLTTEKWHRAHPMLKLIETDWEYKIPYGLLYAKEPSEKVRKLLELLQASVY